jgi:hypothetical protein
MFEVYVNDKHLGTYGNRNMAFKLAESKEGQGKVVVNQVNQYGRFEILEILEG